jgi:glycosyltransferase involved in cell wall biosynthesis
MKICVITYAFYTSTIPLTRYLAELGHDVDLFCITGTRSSDHFTINLSGYDSPDGFVPDPKLDQVISKDIIEYLKPLHDFKIFVFSKQRRNLYISYVSGIFTLSRYLKSQKYEVVHFIGQNEIYLHLYRLLRLPKVFTFHEVIIRTGRDIPSRYKLVDFISKRNNSVIFHSSNTKKDYLENFSPKNRLVNVIKFGLFETYRLFPDQAAEEPGTLLYYGIILPYKGLEYLLEAYRIVKNEIKDLNLIIAGRGPLYFEKSLLDTEGIELINRTISEEELVRLNKRASVVVCPYISASQSGIPVTSFIFNKPILATSVEGITEYVTHEKTGFLVPPADSKALASGIRKLLQDVSLRKRIIDNIGQMNDKSRSEWISIAENTIEIYHNEIQNSLK